MYSSLTEILYKLETRGVDHEGKKQTLVQYKEELEVSSSSVLLDPEEEKFNVSYRLNHIYAAYISKSVSMCHSVTH